MARPPPWPSRPRRCSAATWKEAAPGTSGRCWWPRPPWPDRRPVTTATRCCASCGPWRRSRTHSARCSAPGSCRTRRSIRAPTVRPAAPLAERLGARPLSDQIAALLSQAAGPATGSGTGPHGERLSLTGREIEVLRLVTAGQSNREIAAALFISPKTASVHVSNILGKLGAATRTEAAARAHALHLFEAEDAGR